MPETPIRDHRTRETRARIGDAALDLFMTQGYARTTVDQIAAAAGVGRRTVFRYYPTKKAIVFDQLVMRREVTLQHLRDRPSGEPPLVSLHTVLREQCQHGYDRRLLTPIRSVLAAEPGLAGEILSVESREFEHAVITLLEERHASATPLEMRALTLMAFGWFLAAVQIYLVEGRRSLVETFDEVVAACSRATAAELR